MDVTLMIRKESIVLTAIDLMNEFGVQALSTKEIAKREGISEGAVFKHYPRKSDLVLAVLDYFSKFDKDIYEAIEKSALQPKEAIVYVINAYATYYQGYPAITAITQAYDEMRYSPVLAVKIDDILRTRLEAFRKLVEDAQRSGELNRFWDRDTIADIIVGTFNGICLRWRIDDYNFSFKNQCNLATSMILEAFK